MADAWWARVQGVQLAQGDLLPDCVVPIMPPEVALAAAADSSGRYQFEGDIFDLIVVTQSCDLENSKAPLVAMCPIFGLANYEATNPEYTRKGEWEKVRLGRIEGLHLLGALDDPDDNRQALVVDFHQIYSCPIEYLERRADVLTWHYRLLSPYLEHFSQAFARFFMRVGLPSTVPRFR